MRLSRRVAPALAAVTLVMAVPTDAIPRTSGDDDGTGLARSARSQPFGADCRTTVTGSHVVAYCHNPYVDTDTVRLHVECARWWDVDTDSAPVDVAPALTVRLTGRCWKEIRAVWITHGT
ncbi:hypothetical protein ABZT23_34085 [Streptomyces sp. NPDC005386]|uniref:hypothetical protein n=1 Tax=Streptomyces sp. NPDC005386 TaxID=3154562 RepID=UPI0033ABF909